MIGRYRLRPLPPLLRVLLAFGAPGREASLDELALRSHVDGGLLRALVALLVRLNLVEQLDREGRPGACPPFGAVVLAAFGEEVAREVREQASAGYDERRIVDVERMADKFIAAAEVLLVEGGAGGKSTRG